MSVKGPLLTDIIQAVIDLSPHRSDTTRARLKINHFCAYTGKILVNESIPLLYIPCSLRRRVISSNDISGVKSYYRALHLDAISPICDVLVWKMMRNANIYFVFLDKISMTRVEHTHAHTHCDEGEICTNSLRLVHEVASNHIPHVGLTHWDRDEMVAILGGIFDSFS